MIMATFVFIFSPIEKQSPQLTSSALSYLKHVPVTALSSLRKLFVRPSISLINCVHSLHEHSSFDWVRGEVERVLLFATLVLNLLVRSLAAALRKRPLSTPASSAAPTAPLLAVHDGDGFMSSLPTDGRALSLGECLEALGRLEQVDAQWFRALLSCVDSTLSRDPAEDVRSAPGVLASALETLRELLSSASALADAHTELLLRLERACVALATAFFSLMLLAGTLAPDSDSDSEHSSPRSSSTPASDFSSGMRRLYSQCQPQEAFSDPAQRRSLRHQLCARELELVRAELAARDQYHQCFYGVPFFTQGMSPLDCNQPKSGLDSGSLSRSSCGYGEAAKQPEEASGEMEELYLSEHPLRRALPSLCTRLEAKFRTIGELHAFRGENSSLTASHVCICTLCTSSTYSNKVMYTLYVPLNRLLMYLVCQSNAQLAESQVDLSRTPVSHLSTRADERVRVHLIRERCACAVRAARRLPQPPALGGDGRL